MFTRGYNKPHIATAPPCHHAIAASQLGAPVGQWFRSNDTPAVWIQLNLARDGMMWWCDVMLWWFQFYTKPCPKFHHKYHKSITNQSQIMLRLEANISDLIDLSIQTLRRYAIGQQGNLLSALFERAACSVWTVQEGPLRRGRFTKSSLGPRMLTIGAGASNLVMSTWHHVAAMWQPCGSHVGREVLSDSEIMASRLCERPQRLVTWTWPRWP